MILEKKTCVLSSLILEHYIRASVRLIGRAGSCGYFAGSRWKVTSHLIDVLINIVITNSISKTGVPPNYFPFSLADITYYSVRFFCCFFCLGVNASPMVAALVCMASQQKGKENVD